MAKHTIESTTLLIYAYESCGWRFMEILSNNIKLKKNIKQLNTGHEQTTLRMTWLIKLLA